MNTFLSPRSHRSFVYTISVNDKKCAQRLGNCKCTCCVNNRRRFRHAFRQLHIFMLHLCLPRAWRRGHKEDEELAWLDYWPACSDRLFAFSLELCVIFFRREREIFSAESSTPESLAERYTKIVTTAVPKAKMNERSKKNCFKIEKCFENCARFGFIILWHHREYF